METASRAGRASVGGDVRGRVSVRGTSGVSRLSIFRDDAFLEDHLLMRDVVALGRHPENDIVLDDRTLSRFHARLERRDNHYVVVDLGGQNGVYLNGARITGECDLVPGDRIGLGRYVAIFDEGNAASRGRRSPSSAQSRDPTPSDATLAQNAADISIDLDDLGDFDSDVGPTGEVEDAFEGPTTTVEKRRALRPTLVLLYNGLEVSRHEVADAPLVIGRSKVCDIVIGLLGLSRRHARVERRRDGVWVEDLQSQNGTWVNNARIEGPRRLVQGDLLNFYEYGLLYIEDPDVRIGYAGAEFAQRQGARDGLASLETDRREPPPLTAGAAPTPRGPTQRSPVPILDSDLEDLLSSDVDSGIAGLDLGEGSYLGDEFDDAADEDGLAPSLLEEDALDSGTGTTDILRGFSSAADEDDDDPLLDFDDGSTSQSGAHVFDTDKTTAQAQAPESDAPGPAAGLWPNDDELEEALRQQAADQLASVEVLFDGQLYTQVPLSNIVTRIGSDARCELALPSEVGLRPWHLTLVNFGAATICYRGSERARVKMRGRDVDQAVLRDGDEITLGRVRIVYRCR